MKLDVLNRRLAAIEKARNPPNSLRARIKKLSSQDRATYDHWRHIVAEWRLQFADNATGIFEALCRDDYPDLCPIVHTRLFGGTTGIPINSTIDQAAEIYRRAAHEV